MSKLKVGFSKHNVLYQIERARQIIAAMTGNASFPTPVPTLLAVGAATDACEAAYNDAINGDKVLKAALKLRRKEMLDLINQLADYVANVAAGDGEIILSSGFSLVAERQPAPPMTKVFDLRLTEGSASGRMLARWKTVVARKVYQVQVTTTPSDAESWKYVGAPSRARFELSGLTVGTLYYVRVRAIGKDNGEGAWSDNASRIAL